ncbi:MAG: glycine cleavage system protein H [Bacteroidales bacterium]|nr:glycine cleavage system protein H [Bacteroidales bacterium]
MNQFMYSDIFDTKGIEYLIVIGFLLLIVPFWIMLNRPLNLKAKVSKAVGILSEQILRIPQGLFYSKSHTWTFLEKSGLAAVGMDDLLLHLTGGVELQYLKNDNEMVKRGDAIVRITQDGKELVIASPISGEIQHVNTLLKQNPGAISEDPYKSWLYKIKPEKWSEETSRYYLAGEATEWLKKELTRFKDFMVETLNQSPGQPVVVLQEGGELIDNPLAEMNKEVWNDFQVKFLNTER